MYVFTYICIDACVSTCAYIYICLYTHVYYIYSFSSLVAWASLIAQLVKNLPTMQETPVRFLGQEDSLEKGWATLSSILGFPGGSNSKESTCNGGDLDLIPGLGRPLGGGPGNPLQYSCLENPYGQRSLAGYSLWVLKESYTTEQLSTAQNQYVIQKKSTSMTTVVSTMATYATTS